MSKKTHIAMVSFELAETKLRWYCMIDNLVIQINDSGNIRDMILEK